MVKLKVGDYVVVVKPTSAFKGKVVRIDEIEGGVAFCSINGLPVAYFLRDLAVRKEKDNDK